MRPRCRPTAAGSGATSTACCRRWSTLGVPVQAICQRRDADHYGDADRRRSAARTGGDRAPAGPAGLGAARPARAAAARAAPDVLHCPHYTMPVLRRVPTVVTLHDATFFTDPGCTRRTKAPFFRTATRVALRRAAGCVVDSQATADELVRVAGADAGQAAGRPPRRRHLGVRPGRRPRAAPRCEPGSGWRTGSATSPSSARSSRARTCPALIRAWIAACRDRADPPALVLAGGAGWDTDIDAASRPRCRRTCA